MKESSDGAGHSCSRAAIEGAFMNFGIGFITEVCLHLELTDTGAGLTVLSLKLQAEHPIHLVESKVFQDQCKRSVSNAMLQQPRQCVRTGHPKEKYLPTRKSSKLFQSSTSTTGACPSAEYPTGFRRARQHAQVHFIPGIAARLGERQKLDHVRNRVCPMTFEQAEALSFSTGVHLMVAVRRQQRTHPKSPKGKLRPAMWFL